MLTIGKSVNRLVELKIVAKGRHLTLNSMALPHNIHELTKTNVFCQKLPTDARFPSPEASHRASHEELGPRSVQGALYTYVRPQKSSRPELLAVSAAGLRDVGLATAAVEDEDFVAMTSGNRIFWDEETGQGVYPWAQCYGGKYSSSHSVKLTTGWQL